MEIEKKENLPVQVESGENLPEPIENDSSNTESPNKAILTPDEDQVLAHTTKIRTDLINNIVKNNANTLHKDPELIQALNSVLNSQDSQALNKAKLRQRAKEAESDSQTIKELITATLRAVNTRRSQVEVIPGGREEKHIDVNLVEDQTSTGVRQFTIQELEENVKKNQGSRPEDIVSEE